MWRRFWSRVVDKTTLGSYGVNHGRQIKTVRLGRQPHRDALKRLCLAYQHLMAAAVPTAQPAAKQQKSGQGVQEVKSSP